MEKILVVFYSRTGNTRRAARAIATACGADLEAIHDLRPRLGLLGWIRSLREARRGRAAHIRPTDKPVGEYRLVVLGTPVWGSRMSSPVRAYLEQHRGELPEIAAFVTEGGSGGERVLEQIAGLAGRKLRAGLVIKASDLKPARLDELTSAFATKLEPAKPRAPKRKRAAAA